MSKLSDAIRRTLRSESTPMGFGAARAQPKASMLVAVLAGAGQEAAGADLVVLDGRGGAPSAADVQKAADGAVAGAWARGIDRGALAELHKGGLDFLIFEPESTPAAALLEDDVGYVMALPPSPEESFLRSLGPLNLDAFYLEEVPSPLTVAGQLELTRIGVFGGRPVIARVRPDADKSDLECLRAAGVAVLLLDGPSGVERLKATVMSLPPRRVRKDERPSVAVSLPRAQAHDHDDDDDDDE